MHMLGGTPVPHGVGRTGVALCREGQIAYIAMTTHCSEGCEGSRIGPGGEALAGGLRALGAVTSFTRVLIAS